MSRVLYIGDVHEPVAHPGYRRFCQDLVDKHKIDEIIFIGDIIDWHAITFHSRHPDAPGPKDEYNLTLDRIALWTKAFPTAKVCVGNHDERVVRVAEEAGIPSFLLRNYREIWNTPGWTWEDSFTLDDVYSFHGTGTGGIHPAFNSMMKMLMSCVQGHIHSAAGIKWRANPNRRIFGMDTGCGIDDKAIAFAYGRHQKVRSVLGAGVVLDGVPYHEIMQIGPGEKYHRSNFERTPESKPLHKRPVSKRVLEIIAEAAAMGEPVDFDGLADGEHPGLSDPNLAGSGDRKGRRAGKGGRGQGKSEGGRGTGRRGSGGSETRQADAGRSRGSKGPQERGREAVGGKASKQRGPKRR